MQIEMVTRAIRQLSEYPLIFGAADVQTLKMHCVHMAIFVHMRVWRSTVNIRVLLRYRQIFFI